RASKKIEASDVWGPRAPAAAEIAAERRQAAPAGRDCRWARSAHGASLAEYSADLRASFARRAPPSGWPCAPGTGGSSDSPGRGRGGTRAALLDWLVDVHAARHRLPETLFLAASLIDRYVALRPPPLEKLQLAGIVALSLAAKFEEDGPLRMEDMRELTDKAYTIDEFKSMEVGMLVTLDFRLCSTTAVHHLGIAHATDPCPEMQQCLAQYLLELSLFDQALCACAPSRLAAAAALLSSALVRRQPLELPMSKESSRINMRIKGCARLMYACVKRAGQDDHHAVLRKFSQPARLEVARLYSRDAVVRSSVLFEPAQGDRSENRSANRGARKRSLEEQGVDSEGSQRKHSAGTLSHACLQLALFSVASGGRAGAARLR
ncbi:unnamed protein product, partial [Prorocentrum cordatum]